VVEERISQLAFLCAQLDIALVHGLFVMPLSHPYTNRYYWWTELP
jgi:hypothetical protein